MSTTNDTAFRITRFERVTEGWFQARVVSDGHARAFHNRFGSWLTPVNRRTNSDRRVPANIAFREAQPAVAQALQKRMRQEVRREAA